MKLKYTELAKQMMQDETENPFSITLKPEKTNFKLPALHSFAEACYNGMWIVIGGIKSGFHGTSNNPAPFLTSTANDSMWVIDPANQKSFSVPVPQQFKNALTVSNPQYYQVGSSLYLCGGYKASDDTQKRFNTTSNHFFRIDIPNFIQYVQSGGSTPSLELVFPIVIQHDFVKVTGGELMVTNNNFYLVGGQNFEGTYSAGITGTYTNEIRSFTLQQNGKNWSLANTSALTDAANLHRRDFNLVPYIESDGSMNAIILGGVFTPKDLSYNNPVYIKGLANRNPAITIGKSEQNCNQYTCALAPLLIAPGVGMLYVLLGGITYKMYEANSGGLVIGDNGMPMPFSNLVDFILTDGDSLAEFVQMPPQSLMPGFLGSNASFIALPKYVAENYDDMIDLTKVFTDTTSSVQIGYLFGGIHSNGPTSGTTANGHVNTYANPVLYSVNLAIDLSKTKTSE